MAGLDPAIAIRPKADPRVKPGDDGWVKTIELFYI